MPKQIMGSVGFGGRNARNDVATVQYLLDCVPTSRGGPSPELVIDGLFWPRTGAAIRNFQRANGGAQDGRVDPGGLTLRTLSTYDPFPNQPLPPMGQGGGKATGKAANTAGGNERYNFGFKGDGFGGSSGRDWGSAGNSNDLGGSAGNSSGGWGSAGKSSNGDPHGKSGPGGGPFGGGRGPFKTM